jgi:hypothetical protein
MLLEIRPKKVPNLLDAKVLIIEDINNLPDMIINKINCSFSMEHEEKIHGQTIRFYRNNNDALLKLQQMTEYSINIKITFLLVLVYFVIVICSYLIR